MANKNSKFAGIEYHGIPGSTYACVRAVLRLFHFDDCMERALLLTCGSEHCFLLKVNGGDEIAIKRGFSSGYHGEGPHGLATVLLLFQRHDIDVDEYEVTHEILDAIDCSSLKAGDLERIHSLYPVRPSRWYDYVSGLLERNSEQQARLNAIFPVSVPFRILDYRLVDLALEFRNNPDHVLISGFRRLEDNVRKKAGLDHESSARLFAKAFQGEEPLLGWKALDMNEQKARASLFDSIYRAYRNPRAHKELLNDSAAALREFLLLNHLFHLEQESERRKP